MPGDWWLIGACICHRIRQPLQDRLGGSLEGSSGLLFRSWTAFNIFGWHDRRQSLIRVDSR
jgi:hypothetical protein